MISNNSPWDIVDRRLKPHIFLSLREDVMRKLQSLYKNKEITEQRVTSMDLWKMLEDKFKTSVRCFFLLSGKQLRNES